MNLPKVVADLIEAQNKYDSAAYADFPKQRSFLTKETPIREERKSKTG